MCYSYNYAKRPLPKINGSGLYSLINHHEWLRYVDTSKSKEELIKRQQKVATKKAEQAARDEVAAAARENAHKVSEDKIAHGQEESQQRQGHIQESGEKQRERVEDSKKKEAVAKFKAGNDLGQATEQTLSASSMARKKSNMLLVLDKVLNRK